ncbi:hypothetical protein GIY62_31595 [Burkholderia plantarii]|uniref:hypothetical protein n=1 Tax=Burkholderia plantarii TaxID=41899 RepID=UPI002729B722|nr:hypothetical protein [Burkholderia plantarii]WLE61961.1 hypothetical protein GIY62_31595 [Burkholderia plantarii]
MKQADMCVCNDIAGMPAACSRGGASRRPMPVRPGCTSLHARHRNGIATASNDRAPNARMPASANGHDLVELRLRVLWFSVAWQRRITR